MAVLFFIAGYFSAAAYDRKGLAQFVQDRFVRLSLPTLLYMLAIGPLTQYFLSRIWGTGGFATALTLAVLLFVAPILFGGALQGQTAPYVGGLNPVSAGKCLWEALVCVVMGLLILVVYRRNLDRQNEVARWLSDNAFGVYLIHPPILIGFAILLHGLALDPVAKAALLTVLAAIGSFAASALALRKSPLRRII